MERGSGLKVFIYDKQDLTIDLYIKLLKEIPYDVEKYYILGRCNVPKILMETIDLFILDIKLNDILVRKGELKIVNEALLFSKFIRGKKIIVTAITDIFLLYKIKKTLKPNAIILKQDIDYSALLTIIQLVLENHQYYSETINDKFLKFKSNNRILNDEESYILLLHQRSYSKFRISNILGYSQKEIQEKISSIKEKLNF